MSEASGEAALGQEPGGVEESLLVVRIGSTAFGVETNYVESLLADDLVRTQVPGAPSYVLGVINYRGGAVAVFDLVAYLGVSTSDTSVRQSQRLVVVRAAGMCAAIPADTIHGIQRVPVEEIRRGEGTGALPHSLGLVDLAAGPTHVLDLPKLLQAAAARV